MFGSRDHGTERPDSDLDLNGSIRGKPLTADYVLIYRNTRLAVLEAKPDTAPLTEGVAQAKDDATKHQLRFTYASNGLGVYAIDMASGEEGPVQAFPSPEEERARRFSTRGGGADRQLAAAATVSKDPGNPPTDLTRATRRARSTAPPLQPRDRMEIAQRFQRPIAHGSVAVFRTTTDPFHSHSVIVRPFGPWFCLSPRLCFPEPQLSFSNPPRCPSSPTSSTN